MVTAIIVKEKIQGLIAKSNNITGNSDTTLTDAVDALVEGYGTGSENLDAELAEQEALIDELKEKLANGGGDNTVVDVDVLPTENIDQSKIYRVTKQGEEKAEVWVVSSDMNFAGTFEEFNALNGATDVVEYIIVDEIPTPHDGPHDGILPVYIIRSTGNIYVSTGVNTGVYIGEQFPGGYRGFISDTSEATEDGLYTIMSSAETSTTYGIPDEADNKTVYEHTSATGWKELGAGGGGGSGIIDVTELPEVGVEGSVYRVTTETETEVWGIANGRRSNFSKELPTPPTVYVVDNLPDVMEPYNMSSFIFHIYVLNDTGIGYMSADGTLASAVTFGSVFDYPDKGWVDDINSIDATLAENKGVYCVRGGVYYTYHTYSNGDWVNYKEAKETVLYYLNEDGETYTANVGDYTKYGDFYQIAEEHNGKPVTILGDFKGAGITNLSIPSSVTKISTECFKNSAIQETVYIPSTVTELGERAFSQSRAILKLKIHTNTTLTEIPSHAFSNCNALSTILHGTETSSGGFVGFPTSITSIGDFAFYNCAISELELHGYITSIGANAFGSCDGLHTITYKGTKNQWKAITFGKDWDIFTPNYIITCTDGTIAKDGTETTA